MESADVDLVVATDPANARYLTQLGANAGPAVLPMTGGATAFPDELHSSYATSWVADIRPAGEDWAEAIVDRLRELGADGAIVGITGLDPLLRKPSSNLNYHSFILLREYLPHTRWVGASALLREARDVKSEEEIATLRTAVGVAEDALAAGLTQSPELDERHVWSRALGALGLLASEPPYAVKLRSDVGEWATQPQGHRFEPGELFMAEVAACWQGYAAPLIQPVSIGTPSREARRAWEAHANAWQRTWPLLRPGTSLGDLIEATASAGSPSVHVTLTLEGVGLGDDLPLVMNGVTRGASIDGPVLREGECFVVKPEATWTSERGENRLTWSEIVVVGASGAQRLGQRPHQVTELMSGL